MKELPNLPRVQKLKGFSESKINMAMLDTMRMDIALKGLHDLILATDYQNDPSYRYLRQAFKVLKSTFVILKYAYRANDRERISSRIKTLGKSIKATRSVKITFDEYEAMLEEIIDILDLIYEAKQRVNLGIPTERKLSFSEKIAERV